jgi:hypothetical protein
VITITPPPETAGVEDFELEDVFENVELLELLIELVDDELDELELELELVDDSEILELLEMSDDDVVMLDDESVVIELDELLKVVTELVELDDVALTAWALVVIVVANAIVSIEIVMIFFNIYCVVLNYL